jgi:hypothetical protein
MAEKWRRFTAPEALGAVANWVQDEIIAICGVPGRASQARVREISALVNPDCPGLAVLGRR